MAGSDVRRGDTPGRAISPSGVISLLTDFGYRDPFVGVMKAVLLRECPRASLIDLTHGIEAQDVEAAAFWLEQVWPYFAPGAVHLVVVDPGVGSPRRALAAVAHQQLFVAPDNGVLSRVLESDAGARVVELNAAGLPNVGRTFDGRDVFAPAAARLCRGEALDELGERTSQWLRLDQTLPVREGKSIRGKVVLADHFGNLITNIRPTANEIVVGVTFQGQGVPWGTSYADVQLGECVALRNSWGYVELAVRQGNAADRFSAGSGASVLVALRD